MEEILSSRCYFIERCDRNRVSIAVTIQFASDLFVTERLRIRHIKNEIKDQFVT